MSDNPGSIILSSHTLACVSHISGVSERRIVVGEASGTRERAAAEERPFRGRKLLCESALLPPQARVMLNYPAPEDVMRLMNLSALQERSQRVPGGGATSCCRHQYDCFDRNCSFLHPNELCRNFSDCVEYDCPHRHAKDRVRVCREAGSCARFDCVFLHPAGWASTRWTTGTAFCPSRASGARAAPRSVAKSGKAKKVKVLWRHPGLKTDGKKACGVCAARKPMKQYAKWRWRAYNADLSVCTSCCLRFHAPFKGKEAKRGVNKAAIREWVIESKRALGLIIVHSDLDGTEEGKGEEGDDDDEDEDEDGEEGGSGGGPEIKASHFEFGRSVQ